MAASLALTNLILRLLSTKTDLVYKDFLNSIKIDFECCKVSGASYYAFGVFLFYPELYYWTISLK